MRYLAIPALLLAAACGSSPAKKPPAAPPDAQTFTFDWSPPCRVPATEDTTKDNAAYVTFRYDVVLTPSSDDTLSFTREHVAIVRVAGKPVDTAMRADLVWDERLLEALPAVIMDRSGAVIGSGDFEPYIEAMIATFGGGSPEQGAHVRASLSSDSARQGIAAAPQNLWSSWVTNWIGVGLSTGQRVEMPASEFLGIDADGTVTIEHLGLVDGRVHLRATREIHGEALRTLVQNIFADDPSAIELGDASGRFEFDVITEPATLRPTRAITIRSVAVIRGGEPLQRQERHEITFDWAHATGCGDSANAARSSDASR